MKYKMVGVVVVGSLSLLAAQQANSSSVDTSSPVTAKVSGTADKAIRIETKSVGTPAGSTDTSASSTTSLSTTSTSNNSTPHIQVTVNGQDIAVPSNGSTQQTVDSADGSTSVQVSQSSSGSASNGFSSSFSSSVSSSTRTGINHSNEVVENRMETP